MTVIMRWCLGLVVAVCAAAAADEPPLPWWKTATLYQVYPRSFKDSDGDGVGDLKGITQSADYFKEIGVDAIWLSPVFKSPMVDFGYDISDFRDIDPTFGTLDDFRELVKKMKSLGIKLLLDMVPNHSSDQHPWFNMSLHKVDPYTNYYVWKDPRIDPLTKEERPPDNWLARFQGSAWQWREERQQYNLHLFTPEQIDFDFRNPAVVKEFDDIMTYWFDMGIDGFRMDAVIFLVEGDYNVDEPPYPDAPPGSMRWEDYNHTQTLCQQASYDLMAHWEQVVLQYSQRDGNQRALFLEAYADDEHTLKLYGEGNTSFTIPFNFKLQQEASISTQAIAMRDLIQKYLDSLKPGQTPNWVIGNHDNSRLADRYGPEAVDAMGMLLGVLPGVKVVYYGEEIGMQDTFVRWDQTVDPSAMVLGPDHYTERDRDPVRTPMQWDDSEPSAGFSTAAKTWLPVNPNYWRLNVEAQRNAERSHLKVFQDVSKARKDPVLQRGDTRILAPTNDTLVVIRSYKDAYYVYISNMGSESLSYTTQDFFAPNGLDVPMSVEVSSINCNVVKGTVLQKGSASVRLRPKAAVILRSPPSQSSPSSSATSHLVLPVLLLCLVMHLCA